MAISREGLPLEAVVAAASALERARELGHSLPQIHLWRKLSSKMFGTTCQYCLRGLWVVGGGHDGWPAAVLFGSAARTRVANPWWKPPSKEAARPVVSSVMPGASRSY